MTLEIIGLFLDGSIPVVRLSDKQYLVRSKSRVRWWWAVNWHEASFRWVCNCPDHAPRCRHVRMVEQVPTSRKRTAPPVGSP